MLKYNLNKNKVNISLKKLIVMYECNYQLNIFFSDLEHICTTKVEHSKVLFFCTIYLM